MVVSIVIPAHNEANYLPLCMASFVNQTHPPDELIIIDDNSTDNTFQIAKEYADKHDWITVYQRKSNTAHIPGKKVIDTFNFGLAKCNLHFDLIGKFDADVVLPPNYFETMRNHFKSNWLLGMCSGLLYVEVNGKWEYETIADKNHVRGPVKLYYRQVFELMDGLKPAVGWDTVDVLLCKFHDFEVCTDKNLKVKHLRPTGHGYTSKNYKEKGIALYKMRYDIVLAKIALLKMAMQAKSPRLYLQAMLAYIGCYFTRTVPFVTKKEGQFIRTYRWKGIIKKLNP